MYSDVFCKVYNEFGWNYYPEIFGEQLLQWLTQKNLQPKTAMDLACGTGILCRILADNGIEASGMDFSSGMIAIARENNPSASLSELAAMMEPAITKPAMNNRMKKLLQLQKKLLRRERENARRRNLRKPRRTINEVNENGRKSL